jgi:hypothetical protein
LKAFTDPLIHGRLTTAATRTALSRDFQLSVPVNSRPISSFCYHCQKSGETNQFARPLTAKEDDL